MHPSADSSLRAGTPKAARRGLGFLPVRLLALLLAGPAAAQVQGCDELRTQIEAKIRAAGVARFSVVVIDNAASASGRIVGSCDRGSRKIVYLAAPGAAGASASGASAPAVPIRAKRPAPRASSPIITECKDGSVSYDGDCRR